MNKNPVNYNALSHELCEALRAMVASPDNLYNFELYLSGFFKDWLERYANTPESFTAEIKEFAYMKI